VIIKNGDGQCYPEDLGSVSQTRVRRLESELVCHLSEVSRDRSHGYAHQLSSV
jgi:hypothetical protein